MPCVLGFWRQGQYIRPINGQYWRYLVKRKTTHVSVSRPRRG
jgi:hypothetical protein